MSRTRIKICGITRVADALVCQRLGIDAIGLVFAPASPRCIDVDRALEIREATAGLMTLVALFADADEHRVASVVEQVMPDVLQFHGREDAGYCGRFGRPYVKALSWAALDRAPGYARAAAIIVDSHAPGGAGGTGRAFDWAGLPGDIGRPLILAGGLHAGNVAQAVRQVRPFGVDLSSGAESAPGVKDERRIAAIIEEVARADRRAQDT